MTSGFQTGDFLVFQIESGFGLMRILDIYKNENGEIIWHVAAYNELFPDVEFAEMAIENGLTVNVPHVALTNRAFESTQVAKMANKPLNADELKAYENWKDSNGEISDRSIRLIMGLR
ncbi:MAG TPA: hypothetical protein PKY82_18110 [Pyrinomonadaceae bacterium]|nr:hypothetical protein [Pyrinomonadaceae bacterium]